ncbi:MAG: beta-lactamase family protein [Deltaproteobacteria bacterium]|nr:beta-lactamase family protein [Deltaproteobacteria bacterium]
MDVAQVTKELENLLSDYLVREGGQDQTGAYNMVFEITIPGKDLVFPLAFGKARADSAAPMTAAHQFHTASIAKTMTATLILQLWESGSLGAKGLDTPLGELDVFDPDVLKKLHVKEGQSYGAEITLRQLLTHTSGLKDPYGDDANGTAFDYGNQPAPGSISARWHMEMVKMASGELSAEDPSAFIRKNWRPWDPSQPDNPDAGMVNFYLHHLGTSPVASPGEVHHYSDTGFVILALIAERLSGKSYHRQLRDQIFDPLGLNSTYLAYATDPATGPWEKEISDCYAGPFPLVTSGFNFSFDWGGGGAVTTAGELNTFLYALLNGKLFKKTDTLKEMIAWRTFKGLSGLENKTGLGIFCKENKEKGTVLWGHGGAWGGVMYHEPAGGIYISGTVNQLFGVPAGWLDNLIETLKDSI